MVVDSLDLHNVRHINVSETVDRFLGQHITRGTIEVSIVTGNSQSMKMIVRNVLQDYQLTAEQSLLTPGKIIVRLF